jgi:hypothetical protein
MAVKVSAAYQLQVFAADTAANEINAFTTD